MSRAVVRIGSRLVGDAEPVFVIAEIGINHNGSLEVARKLIDGAVLSGADAVKFQKRTPELCVPRDQWQPLEQARVVREAEDGEHLLVEPLPDDSDPRSAP